MAHHTGESDLLIHHGARARPREAQPSLPSPISELQGVRSLLRQLSCRSCNICIKSKPAVLILVWSVVIGAIYLCLLMVFLVVGFALRNNVSKRIDKKLNLVICAYVAECAVLALVMLLYPVSGYIADVYCGRYKAVTCSFIFLWIAAFSLSCASGIGIKVNFDHFGGLAVPMGLFVAVSLILIILSLACYQANVFQLGLDQLFEAPSEKLGLFVHWLMWTYTLGNFIALMSLLLLPCYVDKKDPVQMKLQDGLASGPFVLLIVLTFLLVFTCYNHGWFYSEPGQHNPYKTVFKVLNFARKNKYPLQRSAFTFCDDFRPSRIDFAKERFGGPFTTSQVEDVKTLLRVGSVLLALGPLFVLEIPGSFGMFPLFALHVSKNVQFFANRSCSSPVKWILIQSGAIGYIASIIFLPLYMWVVYSLLRKRVPRILNRLQFSVVLSIVGVLCLSMIDLIGHFHHQHQYPNATNSTCLFTSPYQVSDEGTPTILDLHWSVSIVPCVLLNVGSLLIRATAFEFISAQSPHSMKGLLVGVFFAIKGLFQFISAAAVVPFAIPKIWNGIHSVTNCGFGYYLFTIVVASVGLVVFSIVVRRYSYRQRDERPYDTRFAEQYYERYISSAHSSTTGACSSSEENIYNEELGYTCSDSSDPMTSTSRDYGTSRKMQNGRNFLQPHQLSDKLTGNGINRNARK